MNLLENIDKEPRTAENELLSILDF